MNIVISPSMTVAQIAELVEQHATPDRDTYVRIESVRGKPVCFLVREQVSKEWIPPMLRKDDSNPPLGSQAWQTRMQAAHSELNDVRRDLAQHATRTGWPYEV